MFYTQFSEPDLIVQSDHPSRALRGLKKIFIGIEESRDFSTGVRQHRIFFFTIDPEISRISVGQWTLWMFETRFRYMMIWIMVPPLVVESNTIPHIFLGILVVH